MADAPTDPTAPLDPDRLEAAIQTRWLARPLQVFGVIGSTNDHALRLPSSAATHGRTFLAEHQSAGRGRFDRQWEAPAGRALLFTFILRGQAYDEPAPLLTCTAAVAARRAIRRLGEAPCEIRWPNDVLLGGGKVCGILTEKGPWRDEPGWVVGIGLNVNQGAEDFLPALRESATSIALQTGRGWDRVELFRALATELEACMERMTQGAAGREAIRAEWEGGCGLIGRIVAVDTGAEVVRGMAVGLEPEGGLIVRLESGVSRAVRSGTLLKRESGAGR